MKFIEKAFNPTALYHHYKSMCKQNYLKYLKSHSVLTYKKYLYAMRGLINAEYVRYKNEIPPIDFNETISLTPMPIHIEHKLKEIIVSKKSSKEKDRRGSIADFDNYIETFLKSDNLIETKRIKTYLDIEEHIMSIINQ